MNVNIINNGNIDSFQSEKISVKCKKNGWICILNHHVPCATEISSLKYKNSTIKNMNGYMYFKNNSCDIVVVSEE